MRRPQQQHCSYVSTTADGCSSQLLYGVLCCQFIGSCIDLLSAHSCNSKIAQQATCSIVVQQPHTATYACCCCCSHPVSAATRALEAAAAAQDEAALEQCLVTLHAQFKGLNSTDLQQTLAGGSQSQGIVFTPKYIQCPFSAPIYKGHTLPAAEHHMFKEHCTTGGSFDF